MHNILKAIAVFVMMLSFGFNELSAQNFEVTPYGGYFFAGKLVVREGDLNIKNGGNYGISFAYAIQPGIQVELWYNRLDTRLVLKDYATRVEEELFELGVNYFQLGGIYEAQKLEHGALFTTFSLGATLFSPKSGSYIIDDIEYIAEDDWRFSIALGGGLKHYLSDKIGLRIQLRLMMPIYWGGGGLYFGTGGSGVSLGAGTTLVQADATLGIIFRL